MICLKQLLYEHICNYCEHKKLSIGKDEVLEDFEELLDRVNSPESLGGFKQLVHLIVRVRNLSFESAESILSALHWPPYIFDALHEYTIEINDRFLKSEYYRGSYQKGWCSEYPFYVLLLKSSEYKLTIKSCELLAAFTKHYYTVLETLKDTELATKSTTREEEACANFRLFMSASYSPECNFVRETIPQTPLDSPLSIANQIIQFVDKKTLWSYLPYKNYLRVLAHFFANDWKQSKYVPRSYSPHGPSPIRFSDPVAVPIVGAHDDVSVLIPDKPLIPNLDGLDEDDQYALQTFVVSNGELNSKRDKTELLDAKIPFNKSVQSRTAIDVTAKVRRSHNMGLQNTQLLMPNELNLLINELIRLGNKKVNHEFVIAIWIMMLLSKSILDLQNLVIFKDLKKKQQGLYIDPEGYGWWFFYVVHSAKSTIGNADLREVTEEVFTPCPDFLLKLIESYVGDRATGPIINQSDTQLFVNNITRKLKKISDRHTSGRMSVKRLVNFVSYYLNSTDIIDPIYVDFSYAVNMYNTRVARSYANVGNHYRCQQLNKLWQSVEKNVESFTGNSLPLSLFDLRYFSQNDQFIGSSFTPSHMAITKLISSLSLKVHESKPCVHYRVEDIINYHNTFVAYTAWMLLFGTGYRAAWNPLPTFALFIPSLNLMGISDKDDSDFSHTRIVAVPNVLKLQLIEYKRHLGCLRALLRVLKPELCNTIDNIVDVDENVLSFNHMQATHWYKNVRNSRKELGPFFLLHQQGSSLVAKNLSPAELANHTVDEIMLPSNAGRHWLKSLLLEKNIASELINFQMGHWQAGEVPLGHYSALSHIGVINDIVPVLDELFKEVGWLKLKSVLS